MNKGFTLVEVLVSLVILSLIGLICSQILSSALESEEISTKKLNEVKELSLSSSIIRRDLRQAVNVPEEIDFLRSGPYCLLLLHTFWCTTLRFASKAVATSVGGII